MYDIKEKLQGECMRKWLLCAGLVLCLWILCGCSIRKVDDTQKRKAVYENVRREEIPEECKKWIEEKKQELPQIEKRKNDNYMKKMLDLYGRKE